MEHNASWLQREDQKFSLRMTIKAGKKSLATGYTAYINYPSIYPASSTTFVSQARPHIVLTRTQIISIRHPRVLHICYTASNCCAYSNHWGFNFLGLLLQPVLHNLLEKDPCFQSNQI